MPADSDWALVAPSYIDRSLVRTAVGFYLSNQAGQYAPRVRLVEAFLTETGGATSMKDYLGVFALTEKIKRGKQRVAVEKLDPVATTAPAVTGGYVFRIDHEQRDFMSGGYFFGFVYPDLRPLAHHGPRGRRPRQRDPHPQGLVRSACPLDIESASPVADRAAATFPAGIGVMTTETHIPRLSATALLPASVLPPNEVELLVGASQLHGSLRTRPDHRCTWRSGGRQHK